MAFPNVGNYLQVDVTSHHRRLQYAVKY